MYELLAWVEGTAIADALRSSGVWTYGIINLLHILGIGALFGAVLILDLRLLGVWHMLPLAAVSGPSVPVAAAGFVLAVSTGPMLISFNATEYHGNPFLYLKLPLIVLGLINVAWIQRLPAWRAAHAGNVLVAGQRRTLRIAGAVSLLTWLAVIACGRMIGYW